LLGFKRLIRSYKQKTYSLLSYFVHFRPYSYKITLNFYFCEEVDIQAQVPWV